MWMLKKNEQNEKRENKYIRRGKKWDEQRKRKITRRKKKDEKFVLVSVFLVFFLSVNDI